MHILLIVVSILMVILAFSMLFFKEKLSDKVVRITGIVMLILSLLIVFLSFYNVLH